MVMRDWGMGISSSAADRKQAYFSLCGENQESHILSEIWKQDGPPDALAHIYVFMLSTSECFVQSGDQTDR